MLARISLFSVTLLISVLSIVAMVLVIFGVPMAGASSAIVATVVAGALTILLAAAFSHGGHIEAKH